MSNRIIARKADAEDKRSKRLYFTEQGLQLLDTLQVIIADVKEHLYADLTTEQLDTMAHGLIQMDKTPVSVSFIIQEISNVMTPDQKFARYVKISLAGFIVLFLYFVIADLYMPVTPQARVYHPVVQVTPQVSGRVTDV